uniref:Uncharacterized protein n=1 Tax=Riboviria sp. TaxID=2585031 RepID=A0A514D753_9VIRU|nr:MAG: hypothetical protein H4Rhizo432507_000001 [Riboviria sp.]
MGLVFPKRVRFVTDTGDCLVPSGGDVATEALAFWCATLPGGQKATVTVPGETPAWVMESVVGGNPYVRDYVVPDVEYRLPPPRPIVKIPTSTLAGGSLVLGRKIMRNYVVRKCLGVLPGEQSPGGASTNGPLTFVESIWKPVHMRVGFFPRRDQPTTVATSVDPPTQKVHWAPPSQGPAIDMLRAQHDGSKGHGIRKVSELPAGSRLRQRARWVLALNPDKQLKWVGSLLQGRWTPDLSKEFALPAASMFVAAREGSVKFLGGGTLEKSAGKDGEEKKVYGYVNAVHEGTSFRLVPELLAKLTAYATFRKRDATLVSGLRMRCVEWCKTHGFTAEETAEMLAPTVALAYLPSAQEVCGQKLLEAVAPGGTSPVAEGWWSATV